jgi:hypothetical protein
MRNIRQLLVAFLMSAVVACGGGGTLGKTSTPSTPTYSIALAFTDASGAASRELSKANPLRLRVVVTATSGSAANKLVSFSLNDTALASFNNGAGTAQTLSDGTAEIGLLVGNKSGAGEVTVSIEGASPVKIAFTSAGDSGTGLPTTPTFNLSLSLTTGTGTPSKDLSKATPLKIKALVTTANGPANNKLVTFSISDTSLASFNNGAGTAISGEDGVAEIGLLAGTKSGAGEVLASVDGGTPVKIAFNSAGDSGPAAEFIITVDVAAESGGASNEVSKASPLRVTALLKNAAGVVQPGKLIKFTLNDAELANFSNQAGTAETNAQGVATIGLLAGTKSGAGLILATLSDNNSVVGSKTFSSKGDGAAVNVKPIGSLILYADKLNLGTGSTDKVELTVLVRDVDNNLMKDVDVSFSADNDAELEVTAPKTAVNGTAKANLTTISNPTLRTINIRARATVGETKTANLAVQVVGTSIEVASPQAIVLGGNTVLSINVIDGNGNGIPNTPVTLTSKLSNSFDNPTPKTDASSGRANVVYTGVNGGKDTITISALGAVRSIEVNVDFDEFGFVNPKVEPIEIPLNSVRDLSVKWLSNKSPVAGKDVVFAVTRGAVSADVPGLDGKNSSVTKVTDTNGISTIFIRSQFAGFTNVAATSTGSSGAISSLQQVEFIATLPDASKGIEVQAFPTKIGPGEKSVITAIVRDINNNPVKNQTVSFSLDNSAGGKLSPATSITNSFGIATTEFEADANTAGGGTPADPTGLKVKAQLTSNTLVKGETPVIVGKRTLFYRFGTGNEIVKKEKSTYEKQFALIVTDSAGNPVPNQRLNVQVYPKRYSRGMWVRSPGAGTFINWRPIRSTRAADDSPAGLTCLTEDKNRNGILDGSEDNNGDGMLTPGNIAVAYGNANNEASIVTSSNQGVALFNLQYPREYAPWVDVDIVVSSGNIAGTENVTARTYTLGYASEDAIIEGSPPIANPYGIATTSDEVYLIPSLLEFDFVNTQQRCF